MTKHRRSAEEGTPLIEWVASSLGATFALAMVGVIAWEGLTSRDNPPSIRIEVVRTYAVPNGYAVEFEAVNEGGEPAAEVRVGALNAGGDRSVAFDFVPAHSRRRGVVVLAAPPVDGAPQLGVLGYREP
jgi:uncharacterized protein (TIGR02588 family)